MSVTPVPDRKIMVNYAIDLLRAHQIRRENVFLHEQLKACVKELATVREEVRDLKSNRLATVEGEIKPIKALIDVNATKAFALMGTHDTQLNEHASELEVIRQSCRTLQAETSDIKASCRNTRGNEQAQRAFIEKRLEAVHAQCEAVAAAQEQQDQRTLASLESLRSALNHKADVAVIELLETRVNEFSIRHNAATVAVDSVSRISDTMERMCPPHDPADKSVQVQDSQHGNQEYHEPLARPVTNHGPREMTVPDDLDLDANAHTISYAGHGYRAPEQNDSLEMLSPSAVPATQLAEIKTLRQRRFDSWDSYYNKGQKLVETLPHSFEGTIIRNFVDGLFKDTHRKQCQQWLDSSGWTWANVTAFGNLCSQLLADSATTAAIDTETSVHPRGIGPVLAAGGKSHQDADGAKSKKSSRDKVRQVTVDAPLRRSQRVAEKQSLKPCHTGQQPRIKSIQPSLADGAEQGKPQGSKHKNKNKPGNVRTRTQKQPASGHAAEQQAHVRDPQTADVKTQEAIDIARSTKGTTVSVESQKSHKRNATAVEFGQPIKRQKSRSNASVRDDHDISIPQLVSFRKRIVESLEESSNDEGFLYKENLSKPSVSVTARQRRGHRKRGLPLPPPPEIPILPTTDEE